MLASAQGRPHPLAKRPAWNESLGRTAPWDARGPCACAGLAFETTGRYAAFRRLARDEADQRTGRTATVELDEILELGGRVRSIAS